MKGLSEQKSAVALPQLPKVTVVVPCYNYGHFLSQCISSVLTQKGIDVTVLVIDDASTDQSASVAAALAQKDRRVRLLALPENLGMIKAMNRGLREVNGDYFVKLDADDLLAPGSLERSVALLERYTDVGFVYGRPHHFTGDVPSCLSVRHVMSGVYGLGHPRWTVWPGAQWLELRYKRAVNCISQPEAVIRTSTLRTVGEYNVNLPHTSDLEMWLRLAAVSNVGRINGIDQGYYREHLGSMQRTVNAGLLTDLVGRRDAFISAISASGERIRGAAVLEATVRRQLAVQALDRACRAFDRDKVEAVPVDELIEFATATFCAAMTLPQWRALERRRRRGRRSRWAPTSLAASALRRGREQIAYVRWIRTGV